MKIGTLLYLRRLWKQHSIQQTQIRRKRRPFSSRELTEKLLDGDFHRLEALGRGIIILRKTANPNLDAATFSFGSIDAYRAYMNSFLSGEAIALDSPRIGALALYTDADDDLVHMGRIISAWKGFVLVVSKISDSGYLIIHPAHFPPNEQPGVEPFWSERPK
jgi:hypothetical protein